MKPLISIIIPLYNSEKFIGGTLKSCLDQSYSQLEIIIINDGSTDGSEEVVRRFEDERIRYYKIPNRGPCYARNFGMEKASGRLLQFLDADDILHPEKLQRQVEKYFDHGDNYIYSGVMGAILKNKKSLEPGFGFYYQNLTVEEYFQEMFRNFGKYYTTGMWLVPRKLADRTHGWNEKVKINNDGEYFSRVILASRGVIFCPEAVFYYRRDVPGSISKSFDSKEIYESWLYSYRCYAQHFQRNLSHSLAKELGRRALSVYYCNSYPKYPDLLQDCKRQIKELGYSSPSAHGGRSFKLISNILGVEAALKLRTFKDSSLGLSKLSRSTSSQRG